MSTAMREVAESQDEIGWVEFLHGKVSTKITQIQNAHCVLAGSNMNGSNWTTQFIQHLIHISHSQWLFRNFTLHHHIKGYLRKRDEAAIQQEVVNLLETSPQSIPRESRYHLEIQYQPTTSPTLEHSFYWVLAMRAAKQAVHLERLRCATQGAGVRHQESRRGMQERYWNIMEGVRESLCRRTQQEQQSKKQSMATGTRQPKRVCQEHIPSVSMDGLFK